MTPPAKRTVTLAFAVLLGLAGSAARADDDERHRAECGGSDDFERAFLAVMGERILPLATILETLAAQPGSALIEIEFECRDEMYIYVFEIRTPEGRIVEIEVDAATGAVIRVKD